MLISLNASGQKERVHILLRNPESMVRKLAFDLVQDRNPQIETLTYKFPQQKDRFLKILRRSLKKPHNYFIGPDHNDPIYDNNLELIPNIIFRKNNPHFYSRKTILEIEKQGYLRTTWREMYKTGPLKKNQYLIFQPFYGYSQDDCQLRELIIRKRGDYHTYFLFRLIEGLINRAQWKFIPEVSFLNLKESSIIPPKGLSQKCNVTEETHALLKKLNLRLAH